VSLFKRGITGVDGPDDAKRDPQLVRWLARMASQPRPVVGLCVGSFVLTEAGLLEGRKCHAVKAKYDPNKFFRGDQNVAATAGSKYSDQKLL
jgi:transcriptional regulator GlxA family with amidase domain